jgi:hypothetical protein
MSKPKTHVAIVLDRSSSMFDQRKAAVEGYNEHIQQLKIDSKDQDITCSLVTFNGNVIEHLWKVPAAELEEATVESYAPNGSTAFFDAIGYTIDKFMAEDDGDEDTAYLMIAISDGEENASSHYKSPYPDDRKIIREIFEGAQSTKRWTFNFLLCSEDDVRRVSAATGVDASNMAIWSNQDNQNTKRAMDANRMKLHQYTQSRKMGQKFQSFGFHSEGIGSAACYDDSKVDTSQIDSDIMAFTNDVASSTSSTSSDERVGVFAVQNQVLSVGQEYKRPEWFRFQSLTTGQAKEVC